MHAGRFKRLVRRPIRIASPYFMQWVGIEHSMNVKTFFGRPMNVLLPESTSVRIWRYGAFEEDVAFYLISLLRSGDNFVDVGAHFGFFSMLACEVLGAEGYCVSFEPMPRQQAILRKNLERNARACRHHVVSAAAGAQAGEVRFKDFGLVGSAFATFKHGRDARFRLVGEVNVEVRTLDSVVSELGLTSLRLVKIDAEDAEYEVVKGSLQTLRSMRPALIIETGDCTAVESSTRRVLDLLVSEGYEPYEFRDWAVHRHEPKRTYGYQNLLMLPAEKGSKMVGEEKMDGW